jgi:hypothetical protein
MPGGDGRVGGGEVTAPKLNFAPVSTTKVQKLFLNPLG